MQRDPRREAIPESEMESIARRFHERQLQAPIESMAALIHADAEMALVVSELEPLYGRDQVLARLSQAREAMIYSATVDRCEVLDEATLLLRGPARYAMDQGVGHSTVFWVYEFRDGFLWRVRAFWSETEARKAYEARRA